MRELIQEIPIPSVLNSFTSGDKSVIPPPEIFFSRYDLFASKGIPTHVTTNLYASELEEKYGNRLRSRMR